MRTRCAIAVGSNVGDRAAHIGMGVRRVGRLARTRVVVVSGVIETEAVGVVGGAHPGGPYLNAAAVIETELSARELLAGLHEIERVHGRDRAADEAAGRRWAARTLDLDILTFGDATIDEPGLRVPHPRMHERLFVLEPLAEIAPDLEVPGWGRVGEMLERLREGRGERGTGEGRAGVHARGGR